MVNNSTVDVGNRVWRQWRDITRFLESTRLAFARERQIWDSLQLASPEDITLASPAGIGTYRVALQDHIEVIGNEEMLLASVLIHSYAVAEAAVNELLGLGPRSSGGIEAWGGKLLGQAGRTGTRSWTAGQAWFRQR